MSEPQGGGCNDQRLGSSGRLAERARGQSKGGNRGRGGWVKRWIESGCLSFPVTDRRGTGTKIG
jgi:hypothetical protein